MRGLKRNQKTLYYQLYNNNIPVYETDLDGNIVTDPITGESLLTGETKVGYSDPVEFRANVSAARGNGENDPFGISLDYTKQIVTCDTKLPINELSLIWDYEPTENEDEAPYKVVAVAKSINSITYAIKQRESVGIINL